MTELAALNVRLQGDASDLRAALQSAEDGLQDVGREARRANTTLGTFGNRAHQYTTQVQRATAHTGNLAAQFNDIGVMLAAGQSPLMLAVQQGSQINQVLAQVGTSGRDRLQALGAAFTSIISPANLATFAIIAGGAALTQLAAKLLTARQRALNFEDALDQVRGVITDVDRATDVLTTSTYDLTAQYGQAATRVRELAVAELQLAVARQRGAVAQQMQNEDLQTAIGSYGELSRQVDMMGNVFYDTTDAARAIVRDFGVTNAEAARLARAFYDLRTAATVDDQVAAWQQIQTLLSQSNVSLETLPPSLATALAGVVALEGATIDLEAALARAAAQGANLSTSLPMTYGTSISPRGGLLPAPGMNYGMPLTSGAYGLLPPSQPSGSRGGGGGGGANPLETQIESLRQSLLSQEQVQLESYARQQEMLQQALEQRLITQQQYAQMMEAAQTQHQERMSQIDVWRHGTALQQAETFFGQMANAMQSGNERMMRIGQAFGAAEALINAWRAFNQVIADPSLPFWAKVPAAMGVLSAGLNAVNAIKGIGSGGGASSAGAAASTAATAMPTQNIMIDLVGDTFSRGSVQSLFEQINEGLRNGERIEGILVR